MSRIATAAGLRPMEAMWRPLGDVAIESLAVTQLRTDYPDLIGLQTGIPGLDTVLRGELEPGHVIVIAGSSGGGKTALCAQIGVAVFHVGQPGFATHCIHGIQTV